MHFGLLQPYLRFGPCVRIIRTTGTSEEQGRLYGYWFLGKGLTSIVLGFLSVPVFAKFGEGVDGLRATIIFYSVVTILAGVLARFVCQDETHSEDKANFRLADMAFVLKMPTVWLAGVVTFVCGQFISALAWSRRISRRSCIWANRKWQLPVFFAPMCYLRWGLIGGQLADRCASRTRFMIYAFIGMIVFTTVYFFLPGESRYVTIALANMVALGVFIYSANAVFFSIIDEVRIPAKSQGLLRV